MKQSTKPLPLHQYGLLVHAGTWCVFWATFTLMIIRLRWNFDDEGLRGSAELGAILAVGTMYLSMRRAGLPSSSIARCLGLVAATASASLLLGGATYDFSSDGQSYQQQAVLAMMDGWNPVKQPHYSGPFSIWISHYALAPWMLSAAVGTSSSLECGKGLPWLFAISAAYLSYGLFRTRLKLSSGIALIGSILILFNPVFSSQIQTFYVDGLLNALITIAVFTTWAMVEHRSKWLLAALAGCIVIAINLKFTAGPFVLSVTGMLAVALRLQDRRAAAKDLVLALIAGSALALLIGATPYLNNLQDHGNPLYPLAGTGKKDILTDFAGKEFLSQNRFTKLAKSLVSVSNHDTPSQTSKDGATVAKLPGIIKLSELKAFYATTGLRIGGFGPWTSLLVLMVMIYLVSMKRAKCLRFGKTEAFGPVMIGAIFVSALIMPEQ